MDGQGCSRLAADDGGRILDRLAGLEALSNGSGVFTVTCNSERGVSAMYEPLTLPTNARRWQLRLWCDCDSSLVAGVENFSLVAVDFGCVTQGVAGTRTARPCLPWATVYNAVGVRAFKVHRTDLWGVLCRSTPPVLQPRIHR
jgi:hypothetical protein